MDELRKKIENILNAPEVVMDGDKLDLAATQDKDIDQIMALIDSYTETELEEFAEFCHEHYLGCRQNPSAPDGFEYAYDSETVILLESFKTLQEGKQNLSELEGLS